MTPCSSRRRSRAVRMSRGAPVLAAMSLKRRLPRNSSRTTSSDHFSPTTSRAAATEQRRGVTVRVAGVTTTVWHSRLANPTYWGYGASRSLGWKPQPGPSPSRRHQMTALPIEGMDSTGSHADVAATSGGLGVVEHPAYKLGRLAPHYDGLAFLEAIRSGALPA